MERDTFDAAIDEILAFTSGDIRRALRAVLIESVLLEEKLRQMQRRPAASRQEQGSALINFSSRTPAIKSIVAWGGYLGGCGSPN